MTPTLLALGSALCTLTAASAERPSGGEQESGNERDLPDWLSDEVDFDAAASFELDYDAPRDGVVVPSIGARWFGSGPGGALAVGLGVGGWQRWTSTLSKADLGASMLLYYEGYDGAARGRSLRLSSRFVVGGGPVHLKLGGDLGTSRHRFDFRPHLDGLLTGGPAADLIIAHNGFGWVGGATLDYFLQQGVRLPQAERSPLSAWSDEFAWYAGLAFDGSVLKYAQQWNVEGPMHLVLSTVLF